MQIEHSCPIEIIWSQVDVLVTFEQKVRHREQ